LLIAVPNKRTRETEASELLGRVTQLSGITDVDSLTVLIHVKLQNHESESESESESELLYD
jgi:hypothetical protein